jgi:hypothetical protein
MGHALAIDTLDYARKLIDAGVPEKQAEVQARVLAEIVESSLATKRDIKELELKIELKIEQIKSGLTKWIIGTFLTLLGVIIGQTAIIVTVMK